MFLRFHSPPSGLEWAMRLIESYRLIDLIGHFETKEIRDQSLALVLDEMRPRGDADERRLALGVVKKICGDERPFRDMKMEICFHRQIRAGFCYILLRLLR